VDQSKGELWKGYIYRLPTKTECEYACRAVTQEAYTYGASADPLSEYGWWTGNSDNQPEPLAKLKPNPWGL
jgi:formylglycine-generating enzyme required for sulfatase activity